MDQSAPSGDDVLADARAAFQRCDWVTAFEAYRLADSEASLDLDDLEHAAMAAFWVGEADASIEFRQRAFAACITKDQERRAAGLAIDLVFDHGTRNRVAVALGWFARAERLLEGCEPCSELGRLIEMRAVAALDMAHDATAAVELYDEVLRIGRLTRDADLVAGALAGKGTALVRLGRVSDGLRLVDESMIDAVSGLLGPFATAKTYCVTIDLCQALGDIRRAGEWTEQAVACSSRPGMGDFPGDCQMHRAEITRLRGDWVAAESELRHSMELLERLDPGHVGEAWYEIGEIELRRGDLVAAGAAFERAAGYGKDPQPGLAMLRLAQGDAALAAALLRVAVDNAGDGDPLLLAQLLPAVVETQLASGDLAGARLAAARLSEIATVFETVVLQARAATSLAQVALADGADTEAFAAARAAVNLWRDAGAPYETAQSQCLVAEAAARVDDRHVAIVEVDAAITAFENLGATLDLDAAQRLRHRLGTTTIGRPVRRTFMFTDIVDSTRLVAERGDEAWSRIIHDHDLTIRELLAKHEGMEVRQRGGGDGFFAVFANPADAVDCAIAIQRRLAEKRDVADLVPEIRIGVHEADALMSGNDFAGLGVHEAARIGAYADAGSIFASASTATAAGAPTGAPAREVSFKGLSDRLRVQEVQWRAAPSGPYALAPDDAAR
jgi:class 3 adenylate cyclase